jgi:ribosomal protection tetracycline resistance protein
VPGTSAPGTCSSPYDVPHATRSHVHERLCDLFGGYDASRQELNLGILAHVDAGKTTLTERLLYDAGVIGEIGSVDAGTTQTDTLALERRRGITIKSAVVSFEVGDVHVNLIDTPGHPDFIAEVERVLSVLDGAVLVLSGVEGVQPQTRILFRALQRLRVPTLMFVNKLDRMGADPERVELAIAERLAPDPPCPVFTGSARTGAGVAELAAGIAELLPAAPADPAAPLSAKVFKIERGAKGEKVSYARVFDGTIRARDRLEAGKVTALAVFERGGAVHRPSVSAGGVAKLWGLDTVRVGDWLGEARPVQDRHFAPPTLESVVEPRDPADGTRLRVALGQLAEQDPLIDVRLVGGALIVSLYGEVQKEVIESTLAADFGIEALFRETTPLYVERPVRAGRALVVIHADGNPYDATIGLRVEPGEPGSGFAYNAPVGHASVPLHLYKTRERFDDHLREYVAEGLASGLYGWQVVDCVVTLTECEYAVADGPPSKRGSTSVADFKGLTPRVLRQALADAATVVCEPVLRARLELPAAVIGGVTAALARLGAGVEAPSLRGDLAMVEALVPAGRLHELQRELPALTGGEGVLDSEFAGYRPLAGSPPRRS